MLPPNLEVLRARIQSKSTRSSLEDSLLDDLDAVDSALDGAQKSDKKLIEGVQKRASAGIPGLLGPAPGTCPICGR